MTAVTALAGPSRTHYRDGQPGAKQLESTEEVTNTLHVEFTGASEGGIVVGYFESRATNARELFEALPSGALLVDAQGLVRDLNRHFSAMTGYREELLIGKNVRTLAPPHEELSPVFDDVRDETHELPPATGCAHPLRILCHDGSTTTADVEISWLHIEDQSWSLWEMREPSTRATTTTSDAIERRRGFDADTFAAPSLAQSEQRFRLAFEGSMSPMVFSDRHGRFLAVNSAFCKMCGCTEEELLGRDSQGFTHPDDIGITEEVYKLIGAGEMDEYRYGKRFLHRDGRIVFAEVSICCARDESGEALYYVSSVRDVTEERALSAQLAFQALHDPLTGLANRALFEDRFAQARSRAVRENRSGAVLLVDLDDFKGVNDTYGHLVGDQLLVQISNRFKQVTRTPDTLCRFGGDEFLYLAEGLSRPVEAEAIARRLLGALADPFYFGDIRIDQRASVGVVVWDETSSDNVELIQNADAAMYEAKRQKNDRIVVFTPPVGLDAVNRFSLVPELRQALERGDLTMHYQPIMDLTSSSIVGFEALMRWHHRDRGWIPPSVFFPMAEQSDLILELSAFALKTALAAASEWDVTDTATGYPYVTVNLNARQFHDPELVTLIQTELSRSHVAPQRLILEVTESVALVDITETLNIMEKLNQLNVGIALDDFGAGYSSLSYLAALNPKIIKIDPSFVRPALDSKRSDTLLEAIVTLGNKLNMTVLAEGIETSAQLDRLHGLDCELGQGFLWSPAVPDDEALSMLTPPSAERESRSSNRARPSREDPSRRTSSITTAIEGIDRRGRR